MSIKLTNQEKSILSGQTGTRGDQMALEIVAGAARMLGANKLVPIHSSHIDGCLYHGDSGVLFCEKLAEEGARVKVPATTNVGALNLQNMDQTRLPLARRHMAYRLMIAHEKMGCTPSWTCAPYQAGMRPKLGQQVAWGESNAVAFTNSVLGARTNRYGDFLDIACAISGRAPYYGLHLAENRRAKLLIDVSDLSPRLLREDAFFPVLGSMIGRLAGETVCVVDGMPVGATDDQLKALCAGAASSGAVALVHIAGITPEAPDVATTLGGEGGELPEETIRLTTEMVLDAWNMLSLAEPGPVDCIALGSPHFSNDECRKVLALAQGRKFQVPMYICLGRHTMQQLTVDGADIALQDLGVEFVIDTCVVVTPILPAEPGVMMTNSAKFAHYALGNTGFSPVFGTLSDCVASAQAGQVIWDQAVWGCE